MFRSIYLGTDLQATKSCVVKLCIVVAMLLAPSATAANFKATSPPPQRPLPMAVDGALGMVVEPSLHVVGLAVRNLPRAVRLGEGLKVGP